MPHVVGADGGPPQFGPRRATGRPRCAEAGHRDEGYHQEEGRAHGEENTPASSGNSSYAGLRIAQLLLDAPRFARSRYLLRAGIHSVISADAPNRRIPKRLATWEEVFATGRAQTPGRYTNPDFPRPVVHMLSMLIFFLTTKRCRVIYEHAHFRSRPSPMRITAEAKSATRQRILQAAMNLFATDGWHQTTTRGIAVAAGIATGTLFNYFPTKEDIAAALMAEALECDGEEFHAGRSTENSLEADLFSLIWSGLRSLSEFRKCLGPASDTIFSPLARQSSGSPGDAIRVDHLEMVEAILTSHGFPAPRPAITVQLYWTLYLGVLAYWAADDSPGQEDTLALLDQSLKLFVASLR
jgi:AcrR family transcriptional regulator